MNGARKIRSVLIVDDHPIVRYGLSQLIEQQADLKVCAEVATGSEALDRLDELEPDIVLVDISLPDVNGLDLIKQIRLKNRNLPVLVLSMHDESHYALRALRAGANGYVMKEQADEYVVNAMRKVMDGEMYVSEKVAAQMMHDHVHGVATSENGTNVSCLSGREFEVFEMIGNGLSTNKIAERLKLSVKTIDAHRSHIKNKLKLEDATQLMRAAVRWVELESKA